MENSGYWLAVETPETWDDAKRKPKGTIGWPTRRRKSVQQIKLGDRIISYMTKRKRFFAVWEVTKTYHQVPNRVLAGKEYPECVGVKEIVRPSPETGVSVDKIRGQLEGFKTKHLSGIVQLSLSRLDHHDGETIFQALREASN